MFLLVDANWSTRETRACIYAHTEYRERRWMFWWVQFFLWNDGMSASVIGACGNRVDSNVNFNKNPKHNTASCCGCCGRWTWTSQTRLPRMATSRPSTLTAAATPYRRSSKPLSASSLFIRWRKQTDSSGTELVSLLPLSCCYWTFQPWYALSFLLLCLRPALEWESKMCQAVLLL